MLSVVCKAILVRESAAPQRTHQRSADLSVNGASQPAGLLRRVADMEAQLAHDEERIKKFGTVLEYLGVSEPEFADPVYISGHLPALTVYKTPDPRVRVEGLNTPPANSLEVSMFGTDDSRDPTSHPETLASMVYATAYRPTAVELPLPSFMLPNDRRTMQVLHQGTEVFRCEVPTHDGACMFEFTEAHAGQRFTVKAFETASGHVLQHERIYVPLPYMCAASTYSRTDIDEMDCAPMPADVERSAVLPVLTNRGFAVEIEFMARDTSLTTGIFGQDALDKVHLCMDEKLSGTRFGDTIWKQWNWEEEPSMVPFGPRDTADKREYGGRMAELTTPGPPHVLLGQQGLNDVVTVFDNLRHMGVQIGLWAQLHVHVNALSERAGGDCCMSTDQIAQVWVGWARFQAVIDEMHSSTNVNNRWAAPLYLEDPIVKEVFSNMHSHHGTDLPAAAACEKFYGEGLCDGKGKGHGYRPPGLPEESAPYVHSPARYSAFNLAPLSGKGTIEIRQNAGTHDTERAQRWVQFVLAFFETFKDKGAEFFDGSLEEDLAELRQAQEEESFDSLFALLGDRVSADSQQYFQDRRWAKQAPEYVKLKPGCTFSEQI